jgi:hypothetical protein
MSGQVVGRRMCTLTIQASESTPDGSVGITLDGGGESWQCQYQYQATH